MAVIIYLVPFSLHNHFVYLLAFKKDAELLVAISYQATKAFTLKLERFSFF